jgi:hypothetical protein
MIVVRSLRDRTVLELDMAHSHSHADGQVEGNYFLDQLFTILTCGGVGLVAVLMYYTGMLGRILVPMFYVPVLLGGIAILALVVVRAIAVWKLAGAQKPENNNGGHERSYGQEHSHAHHDETCGHEHAHGQECSHDHAHAHSHSHAHSHGDDAHAHEHGWAPWRYMVLAVPVFLYFLGLPREGITGIEKIEKGALQQSPARQGLSMLAGGPALTKALRKTEPKRLALRFKELTQAAAIPRLHEIYEGEIGILRGQFIPLRSNDREFTLLRVDRTCCVADQILLETRIEAPEAIQGVYPEQWVRVEGLISFQKNEKGKWIPVLTLASNSDIDTNVEPELDANKP